MTTLLSVALLGPNTYVAIVVVAALAKIQRDNRTKAESFCGRQIFAQREIAPGRE